MNTSNVLFLNKRFTVFVNNAMLRNMSDYMIICLIHLSLINIKKKTSEKYGLTTAEKTSDDIEAKFACC